MKGICFLFLFSALFSEEAYHALAVSENEPSALIEGIVSAITGDLYAVEEDIVIQGAEPICLRRSYISQRGQGAWAIFHHLTATYLPPSKLMEISDVNGTTLHYRLSTEEIKIGKHKREKRHVFYPIDWARDGKGVVNTARGEISAHTNLKNQTLALDPEGEELTVSCPDGTLRIYQAALNQKLQEIGGVRVFLFYHYLLRAELLQNRHWILYEWDKDNRLCSIRTTDFAKSATFARADIHYHGKIKETKKGKSYIDGADFDIHTSDGRTLSYKQMRVGDRKEEWRYLLHKVISPESPEEDDPLSQGGILSPANCGRAFVFRKITAYMSAITILDRMISAVSLAQSAMAPIFVAAV